MIEDLVRSIVTDAVRAAVRPLVDEISALRRQLDDRGRWVSRAEAAKIDGVSLDTIDRRIATGAIRAKRVGRAVRVDAGSLQPASDAKIIALAAEARG